MGKGNGVTGETGSGNGVRERFPFLTSPLPLGNGVRERFPVTGETGSGNGETWSGKDLQSRGKRGQGTGKRGQGTISILGLSSGNGVRNGVRERFPFLTS